MAPTFDSDALCWYGDIPFSIVINGKDVSIADWEPHDNVSERTIATTNQVDVQVMGSGLAEVTWTLWFHDRASFRAFRRRRNTLDTLLLPEGAQSLSDDIRIDAAGRVFDVLLNCRATAPRNVAMYVDGDVEAEVTFKRAWDPATDRSEVP